MNKINICLFLGLLIGCSKENYILDNVNDFTSQCEKLAKCMGKTYETRVHYNDKIKFYCTIKHSDITTTDFTIGDDVDLNKRPTFGYGFLEPSIEVCKMNKNIGRYSKDNQDRFIRYKKCVALAPGDLEQERACNEQYKPNSN